MKYLLIIIFLLLGNQVFSKEMYVPESGEIVFEIIRKNKTIGTHTISFIENDKDLKVDIEVNINVKLGFLTIYKYRHNNTEYWKEGELIKISTNSLTNSKKKYFVEGQKNNDFFEYEGVDNTKRTGLDVIPISYWNYEILDRKVFLDSQKGILREFDLKEMELENIFFNEKNFNAKKYMMKVKTIHSSDEKPFPNLYLWYTNKGELMKLEFDSPEDKSIITYNRIK
tara:strand:+ start:1239 stop:1916 length:678 start_codon:yes stop_codon:yes gene_type:complete